MMVVLLLAACVFAWLAWDAWRMGRPAPGEPYRVEAEARGEKLDGVSLQEQGRRQAWSRVHGVGRMEDVLWLWLMLGLSCLAGAIAIAL